MKLPRPIALRRLMALPAVWLVLFSCSWLLAAEGERILFQLDLTQSPEDGKGWLQGQGFTLHKDMVPDGPITLQGRPGAGLLLEADRAAFGMAVNPNLNLQGTQRMVLEWGVELYPEGASWQKGINREAVMVNLFFGPKLASGRFYLPDSPPFLGLFLCRDDHLNLPYLGKSYREISRYVCLDNPKPGTLVSSALLLNEAYGKWFAGRQPPPVSGIGIEMDTSDLKDGKARALLKRITLYGPAP